MNLIIDTIQKEKTRIEYMLKRYRRINEELPKGSLSESIKNGQKYYYLKYREGKKVVSKYLGKDAGDIPKLIEKRKHTEAMIKSLENDENGRKNRAKIISTLYVPNAERAIADKLFSTGISKK